MSFWKSFLLIFQTWVPPHDARVPTASEKPGVMNEGFPFLEKSWNFVILLKSPGKRSNSRKDLMSFCVNATGVPYTPVAQPSWPCGVVGWWRGRGGYPSSSSPPPAPGQDRPRQGYPPPPNPLARIGVPSSPHLSTDTHLWKRYFPAVLTYAGGNETGLHHLKHLLSSIYFEFCAGFSSILFPKFHLELWYRSLSLLKFHTSDKIETPFKNYQEYRIEQNLTVSFRFI